VSAAAHSHGDLTPFEISEYYRARMPNLDQRGSEWRAGCPIHNGKDPNFAVNAENGLWMCHSQCGRGGSIYDLEMALTGAEFPEAAREVRRIIGRRDSRPAEGEPETKWGLLGWQHEYLRERIEKVEAEHGWKHSATYPYFEADGRFSYVKVRFIDKQNDKTFRQYALSSNGGWISRKKAGKQPILYRLNTLAAADEIFIVNGEKAADRGASDLGIVTTCSPDGEGKWCAGYTKPLVGKLIRIVVDRDEKGETHGKVVSEALARHVAEVKIIRLPGVPAKGDLWNWIEAGGTKEQLRALVDAAMPVEWQPEPPHGPQPVEDLPQVGSAGITSGRSDGSRLQANCPEVVASRFPLLEFMRNDTGNAGRLILKFSDRLRYCPAMRKWLCWDERRWAVDDKGTARRLAKQAMLDYLAEATEAEDKDHMAFAYHSLDARRIANLLTMAECELVITPGELDTHPFLINFLNGAVDLRTGELMPHNPAHFMTKLVHHDYNPQAGCPLFLSVIARMMGNHPDASEPELDRAERMVNYLQRALGYSLTGTTEEKAVFVPFGKGNNGKTTLLSTFLLLLEEYSVLLQVDTLMARQESNNTQADLADLRGARFVMTSETEEGQRLSQGKLKRITQGMGKIKATRKYENPIEFPETHKLWMDTNAKPMIRAADDQATFNRLHPIPFTVTIPPEEIDKSLPRKLLAEAEGILAWAVEGAKLWWRQGLGKPPEVVAANDDWRAENDQLGRFIEECCVVADSFSGKARQLYECYRAWAEGAGENAISETLFGRRLKDRGFAKEHRRYGTVYAGIALRAQGGASGGEV
jgi:P4 family phage/plasmid primase-like protien